MHAADLNDDRVAAVVDAAARAGLEIAPVTFENETRTSADAAREVGCEIDRICKSLVFDAAGEPVLFLMSGANRVDLRKAAACAGVDHLDKADATVAKAATGFSIGATPPFGHAKALKVFVDEALLSFDEVWAAGGRTDTVFPIAPKDLVAATGAEIVDIREER